jgi:signal transduction histidine kinase
VKLRLWNAVACAAQGEFIRHEEQAYAADDHFANIDLSFKPMYDDHGKVNLILVEGRDITEVKTVKTALQQAEKANQLKLKFLAMISHELRTPLTSIKGFATTLLATDVQWDMESVQQFISIINVEADRLTDLVEQLLDLSRLEAGTLSINKQLTTFKTVLDTALPQINILTERHQYITDIQPHLPPMIVDVQRISQVITNLISNAVKYSPVNSVICLKAYEEKDALRIEVEDQGVGIPSSERDIVFQAFRRAGREDASNVNGAGLGLSICRGLVEAHGGQIWIEDKENPGIRICFTIPYSAEDITRRQWPDS